MTIAIIGAGPAGMIAAGYASKKCDKVILIEHNDRVGKKLGITGKGRCNITNIAETEDFINQYPRNAKFLYSALYSFTNHDIINLLESLGVKTKVERGGRVFPVSDKASDVVRALRSFAMPDNVKLMTANAKELIIRDSKCVGVRTDKGTVKADKVILATGGKSYPKTGSTGDGYRMAKNAGHTVTPIKPSLVPIVTKEKWVRDIMGLSLKNVAVTAYKNGKPVYEDFGEMMFTHFGVTGPVILSMSSHLRDIKDGNYTIKIDLKPALDNEKLDARLLRDFEKYKKKQLINSLGDLLPKALIGVIIRLSGVDERKAVCELSKTERGALVDTIKGVTLTVLDFRPIDEAIVTSGGVAVGEINPSTMESKLVKGLYFAGEIIDVDGYTGGYNLQMAYSTGYLAGVSASEELP